MKYFLVFLVVCVALASAAPQFFAGWPYTAGYVAPYTGARTLVAGPTVVNGADARYTFPGFVGTTYF